MNKIYEAGRAAIVVIGSVWLVVAMVLNVYSIATVRAQLESVRKQAVYEQKVKEIQQAVIALRMDLEKLNNEDVDELIQKHFSSGK